MTKAELIAAISDQAGLNRTQAKDALEAFSAKLPDENPRDDILAKARS